MELEIATALRVSNTNLLWARVFLAISSFLEKLPRSMPQQLVVCDPKLRGTRIPFVVHIEIISMDESNFFVCIKRE
jgi:hypothetical protein